jgi:hypothetical protein
MAKQTFTTGQVLTAAQMTDLQQTAMTGGAASTKTVSYVLVAADAGTRVAMNAAGSTTITVNTALFSAGDTVSIQNIGAGVCTVTAGTATVNTSGSLVLAQYQGGILYFTSASTAIFFQFATPASGDIEGVTAGTGISGGGTSGTVTITNSMATEITAKGDLIVGTGNAAFDNLAVGTNGHVLTADSTVSPTGLKWAAAAGGGDVVRITTVSFSAATSASVDSVFSSTYDNYLILLNVETTSGSNAMQVRFRTSGSDNTTSNYGSNWEYAAFGTAGATGQLGSAAGSNLAYIQDITGNPTSNVMFVFNPFATKNTYANHQAVQGNGYRVTGGLEFDTTTSFDGISFICAAGTFGGTISVYGYKKS